MTHIPDSILTQPLSIYAPALSTFAQRFEMFANRVEATMKIGADQLTIADFVNQRRSYENRQGVAVIHVNDVLAQNTTGIDRMLGMTDYEQIKQELVQAVADPAVTSILLDISSPGGSAIGAPEAAQAVADANAAKPVVSYIGALGASAAYYLASASSAIVAQPSGLVGSIGTVMKFFDVANMLQAVGITPHIYTPKQSDLKAAGNSMRHPTPAENDWLQSHVEEFNAEFINFVSSKRKKVPMDAMRGQVFGGRQAVQNGLADFTGNFDFAAQTARDLVSSRKLTA